MMGLKLVASLAGLLFLTTCFRETQSINPFATEKVLGYLAGLDTKFRAIDFWRKIGTGLLDAEPSNSEVLEEVKAVVNQIKELGIQLEHKIDKSMISTADRIRASTQVDTGITDLIRRIDNINYMYDEYFLKINNTQYDSPSSAEYVNKILKDQEGPKFDIYKINRLFSPSGTGSIEVSLFDHIHHQIQIINHERCDDNFSPQLWLFNIYTQVMVTEMKVHSMMILAYNIEAEMNHVSGNETIGAYRQEFGNRVSNLVAEFRKQLARTPRYIRRCDPEHHERGKTFIELERLMQLFLIREDQHPSRGTCNYCRNLPETNGHVLKDLEGDAYLEVQPKCNGAIFRCGEYLDKYIKDGEVCVLPPGSNRFYGWIINNEDDNYLVNKEKSVCPGTKADYRQVEYVNASSDTPELCPYCACVCSEVNNNKTRSFSIRPQESTYKANMVVVGVRLVEINRIIHIQIKEGYLLPGGKINPNSEVWVPVEKMDFETMTIQTVEPNRSENLTLTKGLHYENLDEHKNRLVLEDLMAPKGSVIIGVRFTSMRLPSHNFTGIGLEIKTASFNWTTGEVYNNGRWIRDIWDRRVVIERQQYENAKRVKNSDLPTKSPVNLPTWEDSVLEFDIAKPQIDAGHTVVPFIDSLPLDSSPGMPLGGIGLIYKTSPGYGGFVTPRIHHVDLADYLDFINVRSHL